MKMIWGGVAALAVAVCMGQANAACGGGGYKTKASKESKKEERVVVSSAPSTATATASDSGATGSGQRKVILNGRLVIVDKDFNVIQYLDGKDGKPVSDAGTKATATGK